MAVTKTGAGTLTLTADNTYSGTTTAGAGGTLALGNAGGLGTGAVTVQGTLDLNGYSPTVAYLGGSGTVTCGVAGTSTLAVYQDWYWTTFAGVIEDGFGTVSLVKTGDGDFRLTGTNTYSGGTTVSAGALYVGDNTASGTLGSGAVVNNASLVFYRSGTATIANAISGSGSVTQTGSGTLILLGSNTYTGATIIAPSVYQNATIQVGNGGTAGTLGSGTVTSDGDFEEYAQLVFNRSDGVTASNAVSGSVSVTIAAGSTLRAGSSGG